MKYGWKKQDADERDHLWADYRKPRPRIPSSFAAIPPFVYDQGNEGSCVFNAGCNALAAMSDGFSPSRQFLYFAARSARGDEAEDTGSTTREMLDTLHKAGTCGEAMWPYRMDNFSVRPPVQAYEQAKLHRIAQYTFFHDKNIDALKSSVMDGHLPVFGFMVSESFEEPRMWHSGRMPTPKKGEGQLGGHAVLMVGWDNKRKAILCLNSWGKGWQLSGKFWMPVKFVESDDVSDFGAIVRLA